MYKGNSQSMCVLFFHNFSGSGKNAQVSIFVKHLHYVVENWINLDYQRCISYIITSYIVHRTLLQIGISLYAQENHTKMSENSLMNACNLFLMTAEEVKLMKLMDCVLGSCHILLLANNITTEKEINPKISVVSVLPIL